jgi:adenosylhomocysteine nucleosidase
MTTAETAAPRAPAPPPVPADIGIVAALPIELAPFLGGLKGVRSYRGPRWRVIEGEIGGKLVAVILTGPGTKPARNGVDILRAGHNPRWILSAGFGGALDPELVIGDIVLASEVVDLAGSSLKIDVTLPEQTRPDDARALRVRGPKLLSGRLVTVDSIVRTAVEKSALARRFGARIVDMETYAVASYCSERLVKFLSIRVVSDVADRDLPSEILAILGPSGGYRLGAAAAAIWRRPKSIGDLLALRSDAVQAAASLASVLPAIISRLP